MASSKEYLDYILDQLSGLDDISYRAMMGEYIIYYRGKVVGGIYDDRFLVKTEEGWRLHRSLLKCSNNDARTEAEIIDKNRPGLFINDEEEGTII